MRPAEPFAGPDSTGTARPATPEIGSDTGVIDYQRPGARALRDRPLVGLDARNVSAWFGDHKVLERVSLTMEPGNVTALIGPSGCGKSTFLRILNRMHELIPRRRAGRARCCSTAVDIYDAGQPAHRGPARGSAWCSRSRTRSRPCRIYDNVPSGLKLAGTQGRADRDDVVEASLRRAGLWERSSDRLRTPGGALSGGQQQRLCIARSLAVAPDVLLMDEPCSALDPTSTRRIEETIAELRDEVTDRDRHPQHAAGPAGLGPLRLLPGQ